MNKLVRNTAVAAVVLLCFTSFTTPASAGGKNSKTAPPIQNPVYKQLLMSWDEFLDSETTLDGNVILTGAYQGRGTRHEDFQVDGANADGSQVYISGTSTISLPDGTMSTTFSGTLYFDNATFNQTLLAYVEGTEVVTGGTGAYAGANGNGTFKGTVDYTTFNTKGIFEASVRVK